MKKAQRILIIVGIAVGVAILFSFLAYDTSRVPPPVIGTIQGLQILVVGFLVAGFHRMLGGKGVRGIALTLAISGILLLLSTVGRIASPKLSIHMLEVFWFLALSVICITLSALLVFLNRRWSAGGNLERSLVTGLLLLLALGTSTFVVPLCLLGSGGRQTSPQTVMDKMARQQSIRLAFNTMSSELSRWIPAANLDVLNRNGRDGLSGGAQPSSGEKWPHTPDPDNAHAVDGGVFGEFDEFAFILQRSYLAPELDGDGNVCESPHDAFQIYLRSMTYVDGAMREATIEYKLVDLSADRSSWVNGEPPIPCRVNDLEGIALYRVVRYLDDRKDGSGRPTVVCRGSELIHRVTDFRLEYVIQPSTLSREPTRFWTPEQEFTDPVEPGTRPVRVGDGPGGGGYLKRFGYGSGLPSREYPLATAHAVRNEESPEYTRTVRFGCEEDAGVWFAQLAPGDSISIWDGGGVEGGVRFPDGEYTVKSNVGGLLEFLEDIDSSSWPRARKTNLRYRAAYLPLALRVTLRVDEGVDGQHFKTMERTVWLRRRGR